MRVTYSGGKTFSKKRFITAVQASDLLLVLMTTVLPPHIAAATTPMVSKIGKLNGLITNDTP